LTCDNADDNPGMWCQYDDYCGWYGYDELDQDATETRDSTGGIPAVCVREASSACRACIRAEFPGDDPTQWDCGGFSCLDVLASQGLGRPEGVGNRPQQIGVECLRLGMRIDIPPNPIPWMTGPCADECEFERPNSRVHTTFELPACPPTTTSGPNTVPIAVRGVDLYVYGDLTSQHADRAPEAWRPATFCIRDHPEVPCVEYSPERSSSILEVPVGENVVLEASFEEPYVRSLMHLRVPSAYASTGRPFTLEVGSLHRDVLDAMVVVQGEVKPGRGHVAMLAYPWGRLNPPDLGGEYDLGPIYFHEATPWSLGNFGDEVQAAAFLNVAPGVVTLRPDRPNTGDDPHDGGRDCWPELGWTSTGATAQREVVVEAGAISFVPSFHESVLYAGASPPAFDTGCYAQ
jgi:hypothetical protein